MKHTKVFYGNQFTGTIDCDGRKFTRWQRFLYRLGKKVKTIVIALAIITAIGYAYVGGVNTKITKASDMATSTPVQIAAVMQRIAKCESGDSQYDKNGQVLIHINSNSTVDVGRFQINTVWESQATKLGYDLTKNEDNRQFALWLYENKGTQSWESSAKCWQ